MKHIGYLDKIYEIGYNFQTEPLKFIVFFFVLPFLLFLITSEANTKYKFYKFHHRLVFLLVILFSGTPFLKYLKI